MSDLVVAEAITVLGHRKGGRAARAVYEYIVDNCEIEYLDARTMPEVFQEFLRYDGTLSVADAHSAWLMSSRGIPEILSFDSDFDKVTGVERIR